GKIQELASVNDLFYDTCHPYTKGLLRSLPRPDLGRQERLRAIPGTVPSFLEMPLGCKFCTRCDEVMPHCCTVEPQLMEVKKNHWVRCHLFSYTANG
ncbi:MAG: peptide ABC transporter ATP-binding protein, partial [Chitinivibrionales bacterium]|nr:peptide ABC transporter ATP-binding protein [Chitinivibrionales bacterium]